MTLIHDAAAAASDALFGPSGDSWKWSEHLHKASFRGVPFAVEGGDGSYGRRQAVHQYPYRDQAWVEDIGRSTRKFTLRGFLVQSSRLYTAPDVMTQRDSLIAACETGSAGTLVHPTLGELTVSVPDGGLKISDTLAGNVFPFTLTVIESGLRVFAITSSADAASTVQTSWLSVAAEAAGSFIGEIHGTLNWFSGTMKTLHNTADFWARSVTSTLHSASNLGNSLHNTFSRDTSGRYYHGPYSGTSPSGVVQATLAATTQNTRAVEASLGSLLQDTTPETYASDTLNVINNLQQAITSPADCVNTMQTLSGFTDPQWHPPGGGAVVSGIAVRFFTVLSAGAMADAAAHVPLRSYDDAIALLDAVSDTLDSAMLSAGDNGEDRLYEALMVLRSQTVSLLRDRGASLAPLVQQRFGASLPALYLASRLYQDAGRSDSLTDMVDPVHPAFMPHTFKALSE
ncbi:DNA circularization protein [Enterobacter ludwigii]|uniref:DNA circularization protein n=1 Tax=Enterobacter ludwigii TaxID=299767 RepID=UPI0003D8395F|nr:DNA circularization N-terminal domain-containing protein [Enterobacter ludwigii]AHE72796.1 hypothetical protein M942_08660 [Enterobacter ludwigii]